jgi:hypothetical protein
MIKTHKRCTTCGEIKPISEFYKGKKGYRSACKPCNNKAASQWQRNNPKKVREAGERWRKTHPDHVYKQSEVAYENSLARNRKWRESNPEYFIEYAKNHIEENNLKSKNWQLANAARHQTNQLRRLYGITFDQYTQILESQNNCCAICKSKVSGGMGRFHVDHDHLTGEIRGLLCTHCNSVLSKAKDKIEVLEVAIIYLNQDLDKNPVYKSRYLSRKYYATLFEEQDGKCLICGLESQKLCIDHDHATDKIRGLLCRDCNLMLGHARDDQDILRNAANYLEANK